MKTTTIDQGKFGTAPVFFTAISTILGAILFLRFGFAVGTLGFWGVIMIILLGHLVTIPTALAISEIATNKRVEGGGEYFIISRSFGLNIGATIGIALYLSQAISVAFYVIAFTEAFDFFFSYLYNTAGIHLPRQAISIPAMLFLSALIIKKGANLGVKALYFVVVILITTLVLFFAGSTGYGQSADFHLANAEMRNMDQFFLVFAIIFPAFTGMTAGVGLSGDLKNPSRSIPVGTIAATLSGMIIYCFIAWKLAGSASVHDLINNQMVMGKVAVAGFLVIPLGLAASTISSALGSVMVAPRTLQALARDKSFPAAWMNRWFAKERPGDKEPVNASLITCSIAMAFVALGDVNAVAMIISMFFMVTYGSLCLISFLNHFGSSPAYRPRFKSRWYISLAGFLAAVWIMFKINTPYAIMAILIMLLLNLYVNAYHKNRKGLVSIFANSIFQLNRNLQVYLQRRSSSKIFAEWRPSAICISKASFQRQNAFKLLNWLAYRYGFGTYLHRIQGYFSKATHQQAQDELIRLVKIVEKDKNYVYLDTIISPSYTSAIAQAIQTPGIAGMENNMVIFEFDKDKPDELPHIIDNFNLVSSGNFDICILGCSRRSVNYNNGIHVWIRSSDNENANLMILLSFIIQGHPHWKNGEIKIFEICKPEDVEERKKELKELIIKGRLPITSSNMEILIKKDKESPKSVINRLSADAGLVIVGLKEESLNHRKEEVFEGYENLGDVLFVNSRHTKSIE